nr:unnamed protein product [Callosobruchus chinensis]
MCWYILPISASILPTSRLRRKDRSVHKHPSLPNNVLLAHLRDHPFNFLGSTTIRKVHLVYNGHGRIFGRDNHHYSERPLQVSVNLPRL